MLISHLESNPNDFLGALKLIEDQVRLWIFAYASYLYNRKLSAMIKKGVISEKIPLLLSRNPSDWDYYKDFLAADELKMPSPVFRDFPQIQLKDRAINTCQNFEFHGFEVLKDNPKIGVINFTLPKGSYATTLLAHFFTLSGNIPVLNGIDTNIVDSKEILKTGSIAPVAELFKGVINSKLVAGEEEEEIVQN